jgi:hypothetical protein
MTTEILAIDNSKLNSCGFKGETRLSRWVQKVERISAHHFRVAEYCKLFNKKKKTKKRKCYILKVYGLIKSITNYRSHEEL